MAEELKGPAKIDDWLRTQGYPLEMQVAAAFLKAGFRVQQGSYYEDLQGGDNGPTVRELDVRAWLDFSIPYPGDQGRVELAAVEFPIQCKSAPSPWVAFAPVVIDRPDILDHPADSMPQTDDFRVATARCGVWQEIQERLRVPWPYAYSITTALQKKEGKDSAYEALVTATKAAWSSIANSRRSYCYVKMCAPIVVTSGELYHGKLEGDRVRTERVNGCLVGFEYQFPQIPQYLGLPTFVRVITPEALQACADKCFEVATLYRKSFEAQAERILSDIHTHRAMRGGGRG